MAADARDGIRIGMYIDVEPGASGGTAQSTQGLVSSLGQLDGPEEYVLLAATSEDAEWIGRYRGENQRVVVREGRRRSRGAHGVNGPGAPSGGGPRGALKAAVRPVVEAVRSVMGRLVPQVPRVPLSDGYYESFSCDVMHFPTQPFAVCALPTIYNPHDLQHLHYPQFWTPDEIARRETVYRAACQISKTVVVGSEWIKQDVVRQYHVSPEKVQIIPWAPPTVQYPPIEPGQLEEAKRRLRLPASYALFPAVTWPHKNHLRLLDALAELRDRRGLAVDLVCTGARSGTHWPRIEQRIQDLNLSSQVRFLGFLEERDLRSVYRLAEFLVLPSLYEADSCPIHEAWSEGLPVTASNHTGLPDQVRDAGLLFDANDVSAIADAVQRMATDGDLRRELAERGYRRVKDFDWIRTAKAYRAVYRRAAGVPLNDEERWLLEWDWMRDPQRKPEER